MAHKYQKCIPHTLKTVTYTSTDYPVVDNNKTFICYIHNNVVNIITKNITYLVSFNIIIKYPNPFLSWGRPFIEVCWYLWPGYFAPFLPVHKLFFQGIFVQPFPTCGFFPPLKMAVKFGSYITICGHTFCSYCYHTVMYIT